MNILVTGIHGFVGSNLVLSLKERHVLYGLDIVAPKKEGVTKTYSWDELEGVEGIDAIVHLAGKAHDTKNEAVAQTYFDINTGLTRKVFDYFLKSSAKKFIFFSSVKAAADFVVGDKLTEEVIPTPNGPYGESKIAAENYILEQLKIENGELKMHGKQVYILRPCMIHGPGNKGNLNLLYSVVKKGLPWPLGDFENRRSFTSVDNLCYVVNGLIEKEVPSGIYHMADDEALSTNELIREMCEVMGKKAHIWRMNKGLMKECAGLGTLLHLPLNLERLKKLTENYVVSNEKIKRAIAANEKTEQSNSTDHFARFMFSVPGLPRFVVGLAYFLDKHGLLPRKVIDLSPFHTSLFITNLASIKTSYIHHHCYEFGTTSVFVCMGKPVPDYMGGDLTR